jgi:uncharacterized protein YbaR (Trm112 family)
MNAKLLEYVVCPQCHGALEYDKTNENLVCKHDQLAFKIEAGIPVMLLDKAEKLGEQ